MVETLCLKNVVIFFQTIISFVLSRKIINIYNLFDRTPPVVALVNCKTNHLAIIDITIYQSVCKYLLVNTTHLSYIIILYISTLLKILEQKFENKRTDKTPDNDCLCPLKMFCCDKQLVSLIKWVENNNLKQFFGINEYFGSVVFVPTAKNLVITVHIILLI